MEKLRIALIGQGSRGYNLFCSFFVKQKDIDILYSCDIYADRAERTANRVKEEMGYDCKAVTDYREVLSDDRVQAVLIYTSWETHISIAIDAMKAGKITAMEVGGAYTIKECWDLVKTYEQTQTPFMFMENCCYDRCELLALKMAREGLFGKIVHCNGAYAHDLREEVTHGKENRHYRLKNYLNRNGENYPTHELGPIAKVMDINRGNRMVSLVSVASGAFGLEQYVNDNKDTINPELIGKRWAQGDIVDTVIKCADGSTIRLKLDTTLPGFYNRDFTVRGTKGAYYQAFDCAFMDGDEEHGIIPADFIEKNFHSAKRFEHLLPSVWRDMTEEDKKSGHGGMDGIMLRQFIDRCRSGEPFALDVYDAASWMAITVLSEQSISLGSAPVSIPDFTDGQWMHRERLDVM